MQARETVRVLAGGLLVAVLFFIVHEQVNLYFHSYYNGWCGDVLFNPVADLRPLPIETCPLCHCPIPQFVRWFDCTLFLAGAFALAAFLLGNRSFITASATGATALVIAVALLAYFERKFPWPKEKEMLMCLLEYAPSFIVGPCMSPLARSGWALFARRGVSRNERREITT